MFWLIKKFFKKREETKKDPFCCDVKASLGEIVSVFIEKGYRVDVFAITDLNSFLEAVTTGIDGIILQEYRGEDVAAVRTYTEKEKVAIQEEIEDRVKVQKRLHVRFWKIKDDVYRVKAHTEYDTVDSRHALGEGVDYEQGCEWFRKDVVDTDIKILF